MFDNYLDKLQGSTIEKKVRPINRKYELSVEIARIINFPIGYVLKKTKNWNELDLAGCISDALAFRDNPAARAHNIIKEVNAKYESKLRNTQKTI